MRKELNDAIKSYEKLPLELRIEMFSRLVYSTKVYRSIEIIGNSIIITFKNKKDTQAHEQASTIFKKFKIDEYSTKVVNEKEIAFVGKLNS